MSYDPYGQYNQGPQNYPHQQPPQYHGHYRQVSPPPAYAYPQPMMVQVVPTSGWATASLVLGILGILGGWCLIGIPCILAVVAGHIGLSETKTGAKGGRGLAVAGLILGYVCVIPAVAIFALGGVGAVIGGVAPSVTTSP